MKQRLTALPILYLHIFPLLLITRKDMQKLNFILTKVVAGNCCLLLNQQLKKCYLLIVKLPGFSLESGWRSTISSIVVGPIYLLCQVLTCWKAGCTLYHTPNFPVLSSLCAFFSLLYPFPLCSGALTIFYFWCQ